MFIEHTTFTDIAGVTHDVTITRRDEGKRYTARTLRVDDWYSGETSEEALRKLQNSINDNRPEQFSLLPSTEQKALVDWIQENLRVGVRGKSRRYHSYTLKHIAEHCLGYYVSNGEMKGAMKEAGFVPTPDTDEYDIYWTYLLQRGLDHLRGRRGGQLITKEGFVKLTQSLPKVTKSAE